MTTGKPRKRRPLTDADIATVLVGARAAAYAAQRLIESDRTAALRHVRWAASALVQLCADLSIAIPAGTPTTGAIALGGGHSQTAKGDDD